MTQQKIGRYHIDKLLGEGGMGLVYKAFDPNIERVVAIKTIRVERLESEADREEFMARFFREARISGRLQHPNIVSVFDLGEHQGQPFIVMEFVEGELLEQFIRAKKNLSKDTLVDLISQMAQGLESAHEQGIVHRDIKPQNLMIAKDGTVKILDFGIAKPADSNMTRTGQFLGTPRYCSPEQIKDSHLDSRSDLFSLAVLVHELVTGRTPFPGSSANSILYKIVHGEPEIMPCLPSLAAESGGVRRVFQKALSKDPDARYQTAEEFAEALRDALKPDGADDLTQTASLDKTVALSSTQAFPPAEAPADDAKSDELKALDAELEKELAQAKKREERIKALRARFQDALRSENAEDCRRLCDELEALHTDAVSEKRALGLLENKIKAQQEQQRREEERLQAIEQKRQELRASLDDRQLDRAVAALEALRGLDVSVSAESELVQAFVAEEQERQRREAIEESRRGFAAAIDGGDLARAEELLAQLEAQGAAEADDKRAVKELARRQREQAAARARQIETDRAGFQAAIAAGGAPEAKRLLARLQELDADCADEARELAGLEARLKAEAEQRRQAMQQLRDRFGNAIERRRPDEAKGLAAQLREQGEDVAGEERALATLEKDLAQEEIDRRRNRFKQAIKERDPTAAAQALVQLQETGAVADSERQALAKLNRRLEREAAREKQQRIKRQEQAFRQAIRRRQPQQAREALAALQALGVAVDQGQRQLAEVEKPQPPAPPRKTPVAPIAAAVAAVLVIAAIWAVYQGFGKVKPVDPGPSPPSNNTADNRADPDPPIAAPPEQQQPRDGFASTGNADGAGKDENAGDDENAGNSGLEPSTPDPVVNQPDSREEIAANPVPVEEPPVDTTPTNRDAIGDAVNQPVDKQPQFQALPEDRTRDEPAAAQPDDAGGEASITNTRENAAPDRPQDDDGAKNPLTDTASGAGTADTAEPEAPDPDVQPISPPDNPTPRVDLSPADLAKAFAHKRRKRLNLTGRDLEIKCNLEGVGNKVQSVVLMWRNDDGSFASLAMNGADGAFLGAIPSKSLKPGQLEYYFSVVLLDGRRIPLKNPEDKPFSSKLRRPGAFGF